MIFVENRKKTIKKLEAKYSNSIIIDVTSKGSDPWVHFSPFYPHGNIPIPYSPTYSSMSVEGVWQGLKVFQNQDVDTSKFLIKNMKGLKRTVRKFGKPKGHRRGVNGQDLLDYITARQFIYLPTYFWLLENKLQEKIRLLKIIGETKDIVLLDYSTNGDPCNERKPLSHAALIKQYLEKKFPNKFDKQFSKIENTTKSKRATRSRKSLPKDQSGDIQIEKTQSKQLDFF
jgi:hypothetical protein